MRNRRTRGFTLIELLIVIAIIGILAAVLIPNLLRARQAAQQRAAEAYTANVYTAANAYLSEFVDATAGQVANACGPAVVYDANGVNAYTVGMPGTAVSACAIASVGPSAVTVTVTDAFNNPYVLP